MFDAAVAADSCLDALMTCARRGIAGPVIAYDEGCPDHLHVLFLSDEPWLVEEQLTDWYDHGEDLIAVIAYE